VKKQKAQRLAFSLIELSIVILIIGILIAGVTQASRLVTQSRIKTAQTLTQSSYVSSVRGLLLWLETTMDDSFLASQTEDGTQITQWNDRNPQSSSKYFALKNASSQVTYKISGINGLPTISFDGTTGANTFLNLSTTTSLANVTTIPTTNYSFTFFAVIQLDKTVTLADSNLRIVFMNGSGNTGGWGYLRDGLGLENKRTIFFSGVAAVHTTTATFTNNPEVVSSTYVGNNGAIFMYTNGVAETTDSPIGAISPLVENLYIGADNPTGARPWKGFISELIIFDGALKTADRKEIEKYLGRKYGIKVS
jgi:prepilin-type N-terminal cleavage/methylation domain-containing protein